MDTCSAFNFDLGFMRALLGALFLIYGAIGILIIATILKK